MMERIEGEARGAVVRAQEQARRLGQAFIGCEHLLFGIAGAEDAAGRVLRAQGVTPERVAEQVAYLISQSRTTAPNPVELDGGALSAIGIDLDAVRGRVEEAFGPGALERAAGPSHRARGHLRLTRQARKCVIRSMREAQREARTDPAGGHGTEHLALNLLAMDASVSRRILAALGASAPQLTADITACARSAGC
jgi:ATP-dependent Clp protease ATP-binding subunit ClpA